MSVGIALEVNGVLLGKMNSEGLSAQLYLLPPEPFSEIGFVLPNHNISSVLDQSLDLSGTSLLDK